MQIILTPHDFEKWKNTKKIIQTKEKKVDPAM
jgi:hypothetical protein